jgi:hypothetical protein
MPGTVLRDVTSWHRLYLAVKPSHVGVDVDGLAYPLLRPTVCSRQALPCPIVLQWVVVPFRGMRSPQAWIFDGGLTVCVPVLPNLYGE